MNGFDFDKIILDEVKDWEAPIFSTGWLYIWKSNQGRSVQLCETYPYAPDGDVPLIFISLWYIEFIIESPRLYKWLYNRKYGVELDI